MEDLTPKAKLYIGGVCLLGLAVLVHVHLNYPAHPCPEFLVLLLLTAIVGHRTVRLAYKVEMSVAHPFIYAGLLLCGVYEAVGITVLTIVGTCWVRRNPMSLTRCAFNVSALSITTWLSAEIYLGMGGPIGEITVRGALTPLLVATLVYYLLNTLLVSCAISLWKSMGLLSVWLENFLWTGPSYFAGSSIALFTVVFVNAFGLSSFLLTLPPSLLIFYSYRLYHGRLEEKRKRIEQIKLLNAQLERKVRERTMELKKVNERLKASNRELHQANRMKSQFLANMSHELRTPLNAIIGFSEVLLDESYGILEREQRGYVTEVHESGKHLLALINDILDLSKVEAGKMSFDPVLFDLGEVIEHSLAFIQALAHKKEIRIHQKMDPDIPPFLADPAKVKQILYNLLSNAVKFTPEGGEIFVEARKQGPSVVISVHDTGIGIRRKDQEKIFSEFVQVDDSYGRKYPGTGLGLALVKRFAEMHGGTVSLTSAPGRGSAFTVTLPLARKVGKGRGKEDPTDPRGDSRRPSTRRRHRKTGHPEGMGTVLVVEDNPASLNLVRCLLQGKGYEVLEATNGEKGLELARSGRPNLVLLDIQLPGMDGISVVKKLRQDPATRSIPTVALTAHAMKGDREKVLRAGCIDYMTKPIQAEEFLRNVASYLGNETERGVAAGGRSL